jgi:hypothetical protein
MDREGRRSRGKDRKSERAQKGERAQGQNREISSSWDMDGTIKALLLFQTFEGRLVVVGTVGLC